MMELGKPNLTVFSETLETLAEQDRNIIVVTSDSRGSGKLAPFAEKFPHQIIEVGIAEQNLVGVAAGLASCGKKVFAVSPACFLTTRALEQIKNDVCYSNNPVTLVGISAGVSYGALGSTHHSLHDIAALRAIHNIDIVIPADNFETRAAVTAAASHKKPLYLRFGKRPMPHVNNTASLFKIGQAIKLGSGKDVLFIATGETVAHAVKAVEHLRKDGLAAAVLSLHSIEPLDIDAIIGQAQKCHALVTVEEHMLRGGLGEAVAGVLLQHNILKPFRMIGIPHEETVTGSQQDIFAHYGISAEKLSYIARALLTPA